MCYHTSVRCAFSAALKSWGRFSRSLCRTARHITWSHTFCKSSLSASPNHQLKLNKVATIPCSFFTPTKCFIARFLQGCEYLYSGVSNTYHSVTPASRHQCLWFRQGGQSRWLAWCRWPGSRRMQRGCRRSGQRKDSNSSKVVEHIQVHTAYIKVFSVAPVLIWRLWVREDDASGWPRLSDISCN